MLSSTTTPLCVFGNDNVGETWSICSFSLPHSLAHPVHATFGCRSKNYPSSNIILEYYIASFQERHRSIGHATSNIHVDLLSMAPTSSPGLGADHWLCFESQTNRIWRKTRVLQREKKYLLQKSLQENRWHLQENRWHDSLTLNSMLLSPAAREFHELVRIRSFIKYFLTGYYINKTNMVTASWSLQSGGSTRAEGLHVREWGKGRIKDRLHMGGAGKGKNLGWTPRGGCRKEKI